MHRALTVLLGLPDDKVRVVQTETGGGFGGKEEYPVDDRRPRGAAGAARRGGRSSSSTTASRTCSRRPSGIPAIVRHRTGVTRDGRLTAMDIDVVFDGGAYATLSAVVLSRGLIHASGPYRCDHVRDPRPRGDDQHAAERRVPRLRRAADAVRGRSAHGPRSPSARPRSGAAPRDQRAAARATRRRPASGSARTAARCRCCARR